MLSHHEALTQIKAAKLVAILRHVPADKLDGVVEALIAGGVRVLEFTFDHDSAECVKENAEKIRHTVEKYGDRVLVGCGTALTVQEVEASATDFSAAVNVLKNAGCDVVIACMNQNPLATLMNTMRDVNYNVNVVTSYVNASATTLGAFVDSGAITDSRMVYCTAWLDVTTEAGMADYTTFYTAMSAWELANGESGSTYALNSYAMAGYIAGSIFVQALQAVDKAGLELNYANFAKIMEETEFSIPMGGTISYAGGDRLGVTALALNCVSLSKNDAGVYALTPVSPILSLADVVAATK